MRNKKLIALLSIVTSLVLILIVCGATFLVREVKAYSYYVDSPKAFDKKVISAAGIDMNSSMFFLDEAGIKKRVESKCADVVIDDRHYGAEVINVERIFPDKVSINYVVYDELFQYLSTSGDYYRCFASGKVSRKVSPTSDDFGSFMTVRMSGATADKPKSYFQKSGSYDRRALKRLIDFMHSVRVSDKQMPRWIESVDLTRDDGHMRYMYIKTAAGCAVEVYAESKEFLDRVDTLLHYAWSAFADPQPDLSIDRSRGKISAYTVKNSGKPEVRIVYDDEYDDDDYRKDYLGV